MNLSPQQKDYCIEIAHEFKSHYEKMYGNRVLTPQNLEAVFIGYCFDAASSFSIHEFTYSFEIVKEILPMVVPLKVVK